MLILLFININTMRINWRIICDVLYIILLLYIFDKVNCSGDKTKNKELTYDKPTLYQSTYLTQCFHCNQNQLSGTLVDDDKPCCIHYK